jgi:hypothetical protein
LNRVFDRPVDENGRKHAVFSFTEGFRDANFYKKETFPGNITTKIDVQR